MENEELNSYTSESAPQNNRFFTIPEPLDAAEPKQAAAEPQQPVYETRQPVAESQQPAYEAQPAVPTPPTYTPPVPETSYAQNRYTPQPPRKKKKRG